PVAVTFDMRCVIALSAKPGVHLVTLLECLAPTHLEKERPTMTHGMVSAAQPEAVEAGIDILHAGGNVVDAAIGAALVQTAVDPQMCGIAGMGCMHLYLPASGVHTTIDFHGRAPAATRPDMWTNRIIREAEDGWGFILQGR